MEGKKEMVDSACDIVCLLSECEEMCVFTKAGSQWIPVTILCCLSHNVVRLLLLLLFSVVTVEKKKPAVQRTWLFSKIFLSMC